MTPYLINEFRKIRYQVEKGLTYGFSAFLLIVVYGIIILKLGRIVLPKQIKLGEASNTYWPLFILVTLTNPIL
jgi:hypothetical protein